MTQAELLALLTQDEDGFLERKTQGRRAEVAEALVAFANSVPDGREGVLLIGQGPDKKIVGVVNPDELQRSIKEWADRCYPPVVAKPEILTTDSGTVLAVVIPHSK